MVIPIPLNCSEDEPKTAFADSPDSEPLRVWFSCLKSTWLQKSVTLLSLKQFGKSLNLYYLREMSNEGEEQDAGYPREDDFQPMGVRFGHIAMATHQLSISLHWHSLMRRKCGEEDGWGDGESLRRGAPRVSAVFAPTWLRGD